jgi:hypothetical protein
MVGAGALVVVVVVVIFVVVVVIQNLVFDFLGYSYLVVMIVVD